jgi:hypothetical protein
VPSFEEACQEYARVVTAAVTPPVTLPPSVDTTLLARLAQAIAMDIHDVDKILVGFSLTEEQFSRIQKVPFYQHALEVATLEWNSPLNVHQRMRISAAAILENKMPDIGKRMSNPLEPLSSVATTAKLFADIAGLGPQGGREAQPGEKFSIHINLGADKNLHYEKDVTPTGPSTLSIDHEGPGNLPPVRRIIQGPRA